MVWIVPLLVAVAAAGCAALGVVFARRLVRRHVAEGHNDVLVLALCLLLYMDRAWPQMVATATMAGLFAMLLAVTFVLSRPFVGPMALQPDAFEHSMTVYDSVDKTP